MAKFFRTYSEQIAEQRTVISKAIESVMFDDGVQPADVGTFLSQLAPALESVYGVRPTASHRPPACFAALSAVVMQGTNNRDALQSGLEKLAAVERQCADIVRQSNKALMGLDLGADDLLMVAHQAAKMSSEAQAKFDELAACARGGMLERVRAKLSRAEAERHKEDMYDFNPATESSPRAVALMVLEAAEARCKRIFQPIDSRQRYQSDRTMALPSEAPLLQMAASMSKRYSEANVERLRTLIERSGLDIKLAADIEQDDDFSFSWYSRKAYS